MPETVQDALLEAIGERLAALRAGPPLDEGTDFGPLAHSRHRDLVAARQDALGGRIISTTKVPDEGNFLAPALVVGVDPGDATEEIFGPVATVHPYRTLDEAVALANGTAYGLEGYVAYTDEDAALAVARRIRAGRSRSTAPA